MFKVRTLAVLALLLLATRPALADDPDDRAVKRAHGLLKTAERGKEVLGYVHFGAKYLGHSYKETRGVARAGKEVPGHFALIYEYKWDDGGETTVGFLCDSRGRIYKVEVVKTNAFLSQPFAVADLSIKLLGEILLEAFKDKMSADEVKRARQLIDDANSKGLLELSLALQSSLAP